jgi:hypothetical protein
VHAQRDLWLLAVTAEGALTDEQSDQEAAVEFVEVGHRWSCTEEVVSPSRKT